MINYGVVFPQAILIFVITLLYSVIQPLILVFGAIYFGVAYVVYKYKLLFGMCSSSAQYHGSLWLIYFCSVLQTVRIPGSGLAHYVCPSHMGHSYIYRLHDWHLHFEKVLRAGDSIGTTARWNGNLVVAH